MAENFGLLSKASTISLLLWIFGFNGICVSWCFLFLSCYLVFVVVVLKGTLQG